MKKQGIIMGLYYYKRNQKSYFPKKTVSEIRQFFRFNQEYIDQHQFMFLAGDNDSALLLEKNGITPYRVFNDAPRIIQENSAHLMKHWMVFSMLQEFNEVLWLDWDVVFLKKLDKNFWSYARKDDTPKFIKINNYWAFVNCGVYYVNRDHVRMMAESFNFIKDINQPNDELLWKEILHEFKFEKRNIWWGDKVLNIYFESDLDLVTRDTYLLHIKSFNKIPVISMRDIKLIVGKKGVN